MKTNRSLRKGRCILALLVLILTVNLLCGGFTAKANAQNGNRQLMPIQVRSGDTLWALVDDNYDHQGDIRKAIYEVQQINNLNGGNIQPGQIIYIPRQ